MSGALIAPTLSSKSSTVPLCAEPPLIMPCWRHHFGAVSLLRRRSFPTACLVTSAGLSPWSTDPRNLHLAFRKEILAIIAALVVNAAPASEQHGKSIKFRESVALWL